MRPEGLASRHRAQSVFGAGVGFGGGFCQEFMEAEPEEKADDGADGIAEDIVYLCPAEDEDILGDFDKDGKECPVESNGLPAALLLREEKPVRDEEQDVDEILDGFCSAARFTCEQGAEGSEQTENRMAGCGFRAGEDGEPEDEATAGGEEDIRKRFEKTPDVFISNHFCVVSGSQLVAGSS